MHKPGRTGGAVVLVGALIALATLAEARQHEGGQGVAIRASAGIGGIVKADRWMPVMIGIDSSLESFTGDILVTWGDARLRRAIALPSPGTRQLELYVRTAEPDGVVRVRLVSGGRETQSIDVPVSIVPPSEPVALCIGTDVPSTQASGLSQLEEYYPRVRPDREFPAATSERPVVIRERRSTRCTARTTTAELPRSVRGYDAVDRIAWQADAHGQASDEQREAVRRREVVHALDVSGDAGLVPRPARPERRRGLPPSVAAAAASIVIVYLASFLGAGLTLARRRTRLHMLWLTAGAVVVIATTVAHSSSRLGGEIVVHHASLLEQIPGTDASRLSMRALAEYPAQGAYTLRLPVSDGTIEPAPSALARSEQVVDDSGHPAVTGVFGLASRQAFAAEAVLEMQPLAVSTHGDEWTVTNRSTVLLERCRFADGFSSTDVASMQPGIRITARRIGDVIGPAFTCETASPLVEMQSSSRAVDMRGITTVAVFEGDESDRNP